MAVTAALKDAVRGVLRNAPGPLTAADIADGLPAHLAPGPKDIPRAVAACPDCISVARGRYVWSFRAVTGASVLLDCPEGARGLSLEARTLLWPLESVRTQAPVKARPAEVRFPDGRTERWKFDRVSRFEDLFAATGRRVSARPGGRDRILRCLDGEAGLYAVLEAEPATGEALARRDADVAEAAGRALNGVRAYRPSHVALRLLLSGAYHADVPPSPLVEIFGRPPFHMHGGSVWLRTDLTPAMWSILRPRWQHPGSTGPLGPAARARRVRARPVHAPWGAAPDVRYRLRVSLDGQWSADLEARADHSLAELHLAIQDAVRFGNDHLYAFTLSGDRWDALTSVTCPDVTEAEPPYATEVTLGAFDPRPGQVFHYVFDFGDQWWFRVAVLRRTGGDLGAGGPSGGLPRLMAVEGEPPVQYPGPEDA